MTQTISIAANFDEAPPAHVTISRGRYRCLVAAPVSAPRVIKRDFPIA